MADILERMRSTHARTYGIGRNETKEAAAELTELRATIAKIDKTEDGVPLVRGQKYWFYSPGLKRVVASVVGTANNYAGCYSTEEALAAAKEK